MFHIQSCWKKLDEQIRSAETQAPYSSGAPKYYHQTEFKPTDHDHIAAISALSSSHRRAALSALCPSAQNPQRRWVRLRERVRRGSEQPPRPSLMAYSRLSCLFTLSAPQPGGFSRPRGSASLSAEVSGVGHQHFLEGSKTFHPTPRMSPRQESAYWGLEPFSSLLCK